MSQERLSKNVTAHYSSFEETAKAFGLKPATYRTSDLEKLKFQRDKMAGKCKVCGEILTHVSDTNVFACANDKCKGVKIQKVNKDGETKVSYIPVTKVVEGIGSKIIENIF